MSMQSPTKIRCCSLIRSPPLWSVPMEARRRGCSRPCRRRSSALTPIHGLDVFAGNNQAINRHGAFGLGITEIRYGRLGPFKRQFGMANLPRLAGFERSQCQGLVGVGESPAMLAAILQDTLAVLLQQGLTMRAAEEVVVEFVHDVPALLCLTDYHVLFAGDFEAFRVQLIDIAVMVRAEFFLFHGRARPCLYSG